MCGQHPAKDARKVVEKSTGGEKRADSGGQENENQRDSHDAFRVGEQRGIQHETISVVSDFPLLVIFRCASNAQIAVSSQEIGRPPVGACA